jgi:hypothetical protein
MKSRTPRSEQYLSFIRSRPCAVTGQEYDIVAHHVRCLGGGGVGIKPSDFYCVPLTAEQHSLLHSEGEKSYWKRHGIDPQELITMNVLVYTAHIKPPYNFLVDTLVASGILT